MFRFESGSFQIGPSSAYVSTFSRAIAILLMPKPKSWRCGGGLTSPWEIGPGSYCFSMARLTATLNFVGCFSGLVTSRVVSTFSADNCCTWQQIPLVGDRALTP